MGVLVAAAAVTATVAEATAAAPGFVGCFLPMAVLGPLPTFAAADRFSCCGRAALGILDRTRCGPASFDVFFGAPPDEDGGAAGCGRTAVAAAAPLPLARPPVPLPGLAVASADGAGGGALLSSSCAGALGEGGVGGNTFTGPRMDAGEENAITPGVLGLSAAESFTEAFAGAAAAAGVAAGAGFGAGAVVPGDIVAGFGVDANPTVDAASWLASGAGAGALEGEAAAEALTATSAAVAGAEFWAVCREGGAGDALRRTLLDGRAAASGDDGAACFLEVDEFRPAGTGDCAGWVLDVATAAVGGAC